MAKRLVTAIFGWKWTFRMRQCCRHLDVGYARTMEAKSPSGFARFSEWLGGHMISGGAAAITLALLSVPLGVAASPVLYVAAALMFLVAQIFIIRWMFGPGMRSVKDLGFGSNRQALKYGLFMKGLDWRLSAVALYGLLASILLGWAGQDKVVSGATLLAFTTFGAATQAMRLNRFWPADARN